MKIQVLIDNSIRCLDEAGKSMIRLKYKTLIEEQHQNVVIGLKEVKKAIGKMKDLQKYYKK